MLTLTLKTTAITATGGMNLNPLGAFEE